MSTTPLKIDILEEGARPRDWQPRRSHYKVPLRLLRLCLLGMFLPSALVAGPMYLRYRVYSEQLYPLAISDQRLIDAKVSTTWCQRQVVKVNATFNAYLMNGEPKVRSELLPVSMTRHLVLEDDMKEYWGFYLLRGSSATVSTCVRWPGASLTIIRGHKHLHECAFIGDDSSEELEELLEVAQEKGLLTVNGTLEDEARSNAPDKMKRAGQGIQFHLKDSGLHLNPSKHTHQFSSHELDAKAMRNILTDLFAKTLDTKKKQKENSHHHYEGVYRESANIDKPPTVDRSFGNDYERFRKNQDKNRTHQYPQIQFESTTASGKHKVVEETGEEKHSAEHEKSFDISKPKESFDISKPKESLDISKPKESLDISKPKESLDKSKPKESLDISKPKESLNISKPKESFDTSKPKESFDTSKPKDFESPSSRNVEIDDVFESSTMKSVIQEAQKNLETTEASSAEVFQDVLHKINSLGRRGKKMLQRLMDEIEGKGREGDALRQMVNETMNDQQLSTSEKQRRRRDLVLNSPLHAELTEEDEDGDMAIEEGMLNPDGIAEDRGTVNESTLDDKSNSEFWSSFSSSEERLLECKGLILNLPLTPHRQCTPKYENQHSVASFANTVTYRVPVDGYYFFVFNSENEIQPNFVRVQFDLLKMVYNISNPVHACENSTTECSLPFNIFSNERTILELPLSGNDSQWNEEYVVVSTCEPRTAVYLVCIITVPLLILGFAFH